MTLSIYPSEPSLRAYNRLSVIERRDYMSNRMEVSCCGGGQVGGAYDRGNWNRRGGAVRGVQEAGRELSHTFGKLRRRRDARRLVAAIRHCDAREVNRLLTSDCRTVCFFKRPGYDCVKVACGYGRAGATIVTFDICVRSAYDQGCGCGNGGGYVGGYGGGYGGFGGYGNGFI